MKMLSKVHKHNIDAFRALLCLFVLLTGCRDKFEPVLNSPQTGYLVVEGYINSVRGTTVISLSRTAKLQEGGLNKPELKAVVQILGAKSGVYTVKETGNGRYESDTLTLPVQQYQLSIKTADGKQYLSDLVENKQSPPIDSISYKRVATGIQIYINTHDDLSKSRYYKWNYTETWEVNSIGSTRLKFARVTNPTTKASYDTVLFSTQAEADHLYYCWVTAASNQILLGSTEKLTKDVIASPILFIPNSSEKLGVLYSINLTQIVLDKPAYNFYQNLKSNTETNGSIFDKQPSEISGNVHNINDAAELVLGEVIQTSKAVKRVFIYQPPNWGYQFLCTTEMKTISIKSDTLNKYEGGFVPLSLNIPPAGSPTVNIGSTSCFDCNLRGSSTKPAFWP